ncbi:hypothetical protein FSP39_023711 [Pinctada imbricata]|uniref:Caveolin n=1 Tax=Pinctada imbricata TaxID=66713 RepID=A0AA89C827_PINIB|nr:hypothetical protein FSP39_023711 [Pinctada imbricata]
MPRKNQGAAANKRVNVATESREDRDPNGINSHLKFTYYDTFGEPRGMHSIGCIWDFSKICHDCWKGLIYNILTCFCGICFAIEWGIQFGIIAFHHVWCISPCLKVVTLNCTQCRKMIVWCLTCYITPCFWSCGGIFIHCRKPGSDYDPMDDIFPTKVRKTRIIQTPRKNQVAPEPPKKKEDKKQKKEENIPLIPAAVIVAPAAQSEPEAYYGDKEKMQRSVKRQLML